MPTSEKWRTDSAHREAVEDCLAEVADAATHMVTHLERAQDEMLRIRSLTGHYPRHYEERIRALQRDLSHAHRFAGDLAGWSSDPNETYVGNMAASGMAVEKVIKESPLVCNDCGVTVSGDHIPNSFHFGDCSQRIAIHGKG